MYIIRKIYNTSKSEKVAKYQTLEQGEALFLQILLLHSVVQTMVYVPNNKLSIQYWIKVVVVLIPRKKSKWFTMVYNIEEIGSCHLEKMWNTGLEEGK